MTSETVRRIAEALQGQGVTTADRAPIPPPRTRTAPAQSRDRRSPEWKKAFKDIGGAAMYVCGHAAPVPRSFGDNRGVWPIRIGITTRWEPLETLTGEMDRHHPVHWLGMWFRVWTLSAESASHLAYAVSNAIADTGGANGADEMSDLHREIVRWVHADKLRRGFADVGPEFDLPQISDEAMRRQLKLAPAETQEQDREQHYGIVRAKLELAVHQLAGDLCIQAWDDEGFAAHVLGVADRNAARAVGARR